MTEPKEKIATLIGNLLIGNLVNEFEGDFLEFARGLFGDVQNRLPNSMSAHDATSITYMVFFELFSIVLSRFLVLMPNVARSEFLELLKEFTLKRVELIEPILDKILEKE
jgi:hypothetical protein